MVMCALSAERLRASDRLFSNGEDGHDSGRNRGVE
jgi:hypothetical protein